MEVNSMYEPVHLLMITTANNNKFYDMSKINDSEWEARYGRVGASPQIRRYPLSQWNKKYNEKLAKGYKDMSDMVEEAIEKEKPSPLSLSTLVIGFTRVG